ncbi:hypothetical protein PY650_29145 [Rhizobium calliandrae]|uniref:Uncharacterized protein n=1 Tax=Rhizobium calliandrae TaxID=1312182 RepID=A0ABT7KQT6_9HYPH|nr:hypothetical protein [Rhizobium calliandrae]MDL2409624.1 hypothetical protein [Rhizobium calliandrae]
MRTGAAASAPCEADQRELEYGSDERLAGNYRVYDSGLHHRSDAFAWKLWRLDEPSFPGWLLVALDTAVFFLLILLVGRWDIAGIWTRLVLVGVVSTAALVSLARHVRRPCRIPRGSRVWTRYLPTGVSFTLFSAALTYILTGFATPENARRLAFPLEGGHFVIVHGEGVRMHRAAAFRKS